MVRLASSVIDELSNQGFDYYEISRLLLELQAGRSIVVFDDYNNIARTLDPDQGWDFISQWAINNNFSLGRRGSRRSQINNLINDIANRQQLESEAASALNSLKAKAREGIPQGVVPAITSSLKNAEELQYQQLKDYEKRLFDPLTAIYYNSDLLKDIGNADLRLRAATLLSANPHLATSYNPSRQTEGRVYLSHQTKEIYQTLGRSIPELAPLLYTLYSDDSEIKTSKTLSAAQSKLAEIYPLGKSGNIDLKKLDDDVLQYRHLVNIGSTLTDISSIVNNLPDSYLTQDRSGLDLAIRRIIVSAASGTHVSGSDLLSQLIKNGQLTPDAALKLQFLAPRLELAEINLRAEIQSRSTLGRSRESWSAGLAELVGLNPSIFWIKDKELEQASKYLLKEYGEVSIDEALNQELNGQKNIEKISQLMDLKDRIAQRAQYHDARKNNTLFFIQDQINKFGYNTQIIKEPYDNASRRFFAGLDKIDDFIHYPQRKLADFWEEVMDGRKKILGISSVIEFKSKSGKIVRIPLLNLPGFFLTQYNQLQLYLAEKVFGWSWGLSKQGGIFAPLKAVANYSFGFIQHGGDFRETNFYFGRKAAGNFLNWGARQLGHANFAAMKKWGAEGLLKIGNKVTGGLVGKAAAYLASLGLSVEGIGIALTVAMLAIDLTKLVVGFFKKLFNDKSFRDKFLNWAPAIGIFLGGIGTFVSGIPAAIALGFTGLLTFLATAMGGIAAFFVQGLVWAGGTVVGVLLIFQLLQITIKTDSNSALSQFVSNIVCDDAGNPTLPGVNTGDTTAAPTTTATAPNSVLSCATCLAKYLNECYGPSVSSSNISRGLSCMAAKAISPEAVSIIERSAVSFTYLQCVGFVQASIACGGGSLPGANACGYAAQSNWGGYTFRAGLGGAKPGDPVVFKSSGSCSDSAPGHIGILKSDAGALVCLVDANSTCSGCVSGNNCLPKTNVAGHLSKI